MRDFGASITHTYNRLRYETCLSKVFSCYYCKCKCCCRTAINNFIPPLIDTDSDTEPDYVQAPAPAPGQHPHPHPHQHHLLLILFSTETQNNTEYSRNYKRFRKEIIRSCMLYKT